MADWLAGFGLGLQNLGRGIGDLTESRRRDEELKLRKQQVEQAMQLGKLQLEDIPKQQAATRVKSRIAVEGASAFDDPEFLKDYQLASGGSVGTEQVPLFPTKTISPAGIQDAKPTEARQAWSAANHASGVTGAKIPFNLQAEEATKRMALADQEFLMDISHRLFGTGQATPEASQGGNGLMTAPNVSSSLNPPQMPPEQALQQLRQAGVAPMPSHVPRPAMAVSHQQPPQAPPQAPPQMPAPAAPPSMAVSHNAAPAIVDPISELFAKNPSEWTPKDRFMAEFLGQRLKIPLSATALAGPVPVPGEGQRMRMADTDRALIALTEAKRNFKPDYVGPYFPTGQKLKGMAPNALRQMVPSVKISPDAAKFHADSATLLLLVTNALAGKQMTEGEKAMVMGMVPLKTDQPEEWATKSEQTELNLRALKMLDSGRVHDFATATTLAKQEMGMPGQPGQPGMGQPPPGQAPMPGAPGGQVPMSAQKAAQLIAQYKGSPPTQAEIQAFISKNPYEQ